METDADRATANRAAERPSDPQGSSRFEVDPHFIVRVIGAAGDRDGPELRRLLAGIHPADIADVLERVPEETLRVTLALVGAQLPPEFLAELSWEKREAVLPLLPEAYVARALSELDTDDAAAVAADLAPERLESALQAADDETRLALRQNLAAGEETAGRLMQREFVAAPEFWTVGLVIDHMRSAGEDLPERFFEVYVVDPSFRPVGAAPLSSILRATRETTLKSLMQPIRALISPEMDQEEVAFAFQKYALVSAPVVDEAGRLAGMVTVDDIVHVISEETGEDLLRLSGVSEEGGVRDTLFRSVRSRIPWLCVNLLTAMAASSVIANFEDSISTLVALAVLMPVVASLGGNAGTQTLAVSVRAIAARELTLDNPWPHVLRELLTAISNGVVVAALLAGAAGVWFQSGGIALAIGAAIMINFTAAGLAGSIVPLALKRFGADPAVASSVFVTFITDLVGFLSFLGLGTAILLR